MTRLLALEGIHNARDFGDYPATGKRVKRGHLFRTANHAEATEADLEFLKSLNLTAIVDLRRPDERTRDPSRRWAGFAARVIENDIQQDISDSAGRPSGGALEAARVHAFYNGYYAAAPFERRHVDLFTRYFAALAEGGPVLIHCTAGKDRTGMLAAFTLLLAGAHHDDVMSDYLLTNDPETLEKRTPAIARNLASAGFAIENDEIARLLAGVAPEYLDTALGALKQRRGSLDAYLEQDLGVDRRMRERIAANLYA